MALYSSNDLSRALPAATSFSVSSPDREAPPGHMTEFLERPTPNLTLGVTTPGPSNG